MPSNKDKPGFYVEANRGFHKSFPYVVSEVKKFESNQGFPGGTEIRVVALFRDENEAINYADLRNTAIDICSNCKGKKFFQLQGNGVLVECSFCR